MKNYKNKLCRRSFFSVMLGAGALMAQPAKAAKINLSNGVAIQGYDPVAYFTQNMAVKGDASISVEFTGSTYQFSNAENRDLFLANPSKYMPQYGGYCAFAVANGALAPIDPEAFTVVNNRLYLNLSKDIRSRWLRDTSGNIAAGDRNWSSLSQ